MPPRAAGVPHALCIALPAAAAVGDPARLLPRDEYARYRGYHHGDDARRFLAGRVLARHLVSGVLGCRPRDVSLTVSSTGQPGVADAASLSFSITHSGDVVGCALRENGTVGFDVEPRAHRALAFELVREYCSVEELALLAALDAATAARCALQLWTLKEAWAKATGRGLDDPRRTGFLPGERIVMQGAADAEEWQFVSGDDAVGCWAYALRPRLPAHVVPRSPTLLSGAAWAALVARYD